MLGLSDPGRGVLGQPEVLRFRLKLAFDKQRELSDRSKHRAMSQFKIEFSDNSSIEGDSSVILNDNYIFGPFRPVRVIFRFHNYDMDRSLELSLSHGDSSYGNIVEVIGTEDRWVNDCYMQLKNAVDSVRPQTLWFRRHGTLTLHLIALGLGSLIQLCFDIVIGWFMDVSGMFSIIKPLPPDSPWRSFFASLLPLFYLWRWLWRWFLGWWWAFDIRVWLFSLWPNIELDIGSEHLKLEKKQRQRLCTVICLIVLPIIAAMIYDIIKFMMFRNLGK